MISNLCIFLTVNIPYVAFMTKKKVDRFVWILYQEDVQLCLSGGANVATPSTYKFKLLTDLV